MRTATAASMGSTFRRAKFGWDGVRSDVPSGRSVLGDPAFSGNLSIVQQIHRKFVVPRGSTGAFIEVNSSQRKG